MSENEAADKPTDHEGLAGRAIERLGNLLIVLDVAVLAGVSPLVNNDLSEVVATAAGVAIWAAVLSGGCVLANVAAEFPHIKADKAVEKGIVWNSRQDTWVELTKREREAQRAVAERWRLRRWATLKAATGFWAVAALALALALFVQLLD